MVVLLGAEAIIAGIGGLGGGKSCGAKSLSGFDSRLLGFRSRGGSRKVERELTSSAR